MFDCLTPTYSIEKNDRLIQICAPGLMPIFVELTSNIDDLGAKTLRGEGGIGSTGR
jgi:dUTPase